MISTSAVLVFVGFTGGSVFLYRIFRVARAVRGAYTAHRRVRKLMAFARI